MPSVLATAFVKIETIGTDIGRELKTQMDGAAGSATASGRKAGNAWASGFQKSKITHAANMISMAMAAGAVASVAMAAKFDAAMTRLNTQAGVTQAKVAGLSKGVLKLAGEVGFSPDSLAESLYHVESNFESMGISSKKAMSLVRTAAHGAAVGGANLVDVTNALTAAVAANIPGVKNFDSAMGVLNATVGVGDMQMQDLADAFGTGMVAVVKGYGLSIKDVGSALAVFGDNNIRGAHAGTQLRIAVQALAVPAKAGSDELHRIGLNADAFSKVMAKGGLLPAVQLLVEHLHKAGLGANEMGNAITTIFGKKAGTGVSILAEQLTRLQSKYGALDKAAGNFGKAWQTTAKTPAQQMKELGASADALAIQIGNKLMPVAMALLGFLRGNVGAVSKFAVAVLAAAAAVTLLSLALRVAKGAAMLWTGVTKIAAGVAWFFRSTIIGTRIGLLALTAQTYAVAAAQKVATAAQWLFNIAMDANPVTIVIAAIVALVAGIVFLVLKCKPFRDFWIGLWKDAVHVVMAAVGGIVAGWNAVVGGLEAGVKFIIGVFDKIKAAIVGGFDKWWASHGEEVKQLWRDLWGSLVTIFHVFWDPISAAAKGGWKILEAVFRFGGGVISAVFRFAFRIISDVTRTVFGGIWAFLKITWQKITTIFRAALGGIESFVTVAWGKVAMIFRVAWDIIVTTVKIAWHALVTFLRIGFATVRFIVKAAWDTLVMIFSVALDLITGHWHKAWADIRNWAVQLWHALLQAARSVLGAIEGAFGTAWHSIASTARTVWNGITGFFGNVWKGIKAGFRDMVRGVEVVWNTIKNIAEAPVRFIINTVYDKGIVPVVNAVGGLIGLHLKPIHMARGGIVPGQGVGDRVPAMLEPQERVLSRLQVAMLGGHHVIDALVGRGGSGVGGKYLQGGIAGTNGSSPVSGRFPGHPTTGPGSGWLARAFRNLVGDAAAGLAHHILFPLLNAVPTGNTILGRDIKKIPERMIDHVIDLIKGTGGGAQASAIVRMAKSFVGKVPYVWGGTTPSGWDCSGFVKWIYEHNGISGVPRVSSAQSSWVKRTHPTPGGLAFYSGSDGSPQFPGHVGIIVSPGQIVNALGTGLGTRYDKLTGGSAGNLLFAGVPPGGFGAGAGHIGKSQAAAQLWMRQHMADYGWKQGQFPPLQALWNGESGWRWNAQNPSSGAYGIPQSLPGNKMAVVAGDWRTNPVTQMRWGAEYIRGVYGDPSNAYGKWLSRSPHWYDAGGTISEPIAGFGLRTGTPYRFGGRGRETVVPAAASGAASLDDVCDLLESLIGAVSSAAAATADGVAGALSGTARSAGYRAMYDTRG